MAKLKDMTGQKFGRLRVTRRSANDKYGNARWECLCECGTRKIILGTDLRNGTTKSCGCLKREKSVENGKLRFVHGGSRTRLYQTWRSMIHRCKSNSPQHEGYYDRGIRVCEEWSKWENFRDWANLNGYDDELTIDRIDNDQGYNPENCRWADAKTQARNRSSNRVLTIEGESKTLVEWCEELDLNYGTVLSRLDRGWSDEKALFTHVRPIKKNRRVN